MPADLVDLLWRDRQGGPARPERGPRPRLTTADVVAAAIRVADAESLAAVTVRRLATELGVATMSVYTYVGAREDLLVLMADAVAAPGEHERSDAAAPDGAPDSGNAVATAVTALALSQLRRWSAHPWLLDVHDQRTALGPGTIARYDLELSRLVVLGLSDVDTDAALTFVTDFTRGAARARLGDAAADRMAQVWASAGERVARHLGDDHPLARRIGAAAGAAQGAARSADHAWRFGLQRVVDALTLLTARSSAGDANGAATREG